MFKNIRCFSWLIAKNLLYAISLLTAIVGIRLLLEFLSILLEQNTGMNGDVAKGLVGITTFIVLLTGFGIWWDLLFSESENKSFFRNNKKTENTELTNKQ